MDKIKEVMGLVDEIAYLSEKTRPVEHLRKLLESKLRELMAREPLDAHEVGCLIETAAYLSTESMRRSDFINGIRYAERAHGIGIGNESKEM